jgi:hypothetical protein
LVGVIGLERGGEVGHGCALALVKPQGDLPLQLSHGPPVLGGFGCVPAVQLGLVGPRVEEHLVMGPADLCRQRLHFLGLGPYRRKAAHVEQVAAREAARRAGLEAQVLGDPPDDIVAPSRGLLLGEDVSAD